MLTFSRRGFLIAASTVPAAMLLSGCGGEGDATNPPAIEAKPFPEAEALFRTDPRWLGGDAVYSIDLGNSRVLWLFGDSFVDLSTKHSRHSAKMPHSTVAVQTGLDLATSKLQFYWN